MKKPGNRRVRTGIAGILAAVMLLVLAGCGKAVQAAATPPRDPDSGVVRQESRVTGETAESIAGSTDELAQSAAEDLMDAIVYDSSEFLAEIPEWDGEFPFIAVNENVPVFAPEEIYKSPAEKLDPLDSLGRCGTCTALLGTEIMPQGTRGNISEVHPTGWHPDQYEFIDGGNLYNRCHLIGWQLTGDDAIPENLLTGTRYMNINGMLPFENSIADYLRMTGNHVMYRVTPRFDGEDLVARGVQLEAWSVEDEGEGIRFNVFCYNVQPGVLIDYATGDNEPDPAPVTRMVLPVTGGDEEEAEEAAEETYILNTNTKKFHYPWCKSVNQMKDKNKQEVTASREEIIEKGYVPCKNCNP